MQELLLVNPRKRRRAKKRPARTSSRRRAVKRRRRNPYPLAGNPRRRRARRRNPAPRLTARSVQDQLMGAVPGAFGALGLDVALGFIPLPMTFKTGIPGYITKAVGAVGLGMLASNFVKAKTAAEVTQGALTVMFHGVLRELTQQYAPQIPLGAYLYPNRSMGYYGSGWNPSRSLAWGGNGGGSSMGLYLPDLSSETLEPDQTGFGAGSFTTDEDYL